MSEQIECVSTDCHWLYSRKKAEDKTDQVARLQGLIKELELNASLEESLTPSLSPEPEEDHTRESSAETTFWPEDDTNPGTMYFTDTMPLAFLPGSPIVCVVSRPFADDSHSSLRTSCRILNK